MSTEQMKLTPSQEEQIANAKSVQEISGLMREFLLASGEYRTDNDPTILIPVERPMSANAPHVKVLRINGVVHTIQADSAEGLVQAELAKMRELFDPANTNDQPQRDAAGRFTARQEEIDAEAERAAQLLEKENSADAATNEVVRKALLAQGIDPDALQEFSAKKYEQSWAAAGEEFRNSPAGENWPGGKRNQEILAQLMISNNLQDADDKVGALAAAFKFGVENGLFVENENAEYERKIAEARTPDELRAAAGYTDPSMSSGLFGR